jgi:hypothetical protein
VKAIPNLSSSSTKSSLSSDIQIGMELGKTCTHLVRYDNVFEEGDFQIIIMNFFENGDLQTYLKKINKLNEKVYFYFFLYFLYFFL